MKEIVITVAAKDYTINLNDDNFANVLKKDLDRLLQDKGQIGVKDLLTAFIQKCHEDYLQKGNINSSVDKILSDLDKTLIRS